jgi:hypothetical protein
MGVNVKEKVAGSGVWWLFINHCGKRISKRVGSEEAAKIAARKIEARLTLGETGLPEPKGAKPTIEEYYQRFEATHMTTRCAHRRRGNTESTFDFTSYQSLASFESMKSAGRESRVSQRSYARRKRPCRSPGTIDRSLKDRFQKTRFA